MIPSRSGENLFLSGKREQRDGTEGSDDDRDVAVDIFKVMLQEFQGRVDETQIRELDRRYPNFLSITKRNKNKFLIFQRQGRVEFVSIYHKYARMCLNYNSGSKQCEAVSCPYFHICKDFITESCSFGDRCKYSHQFFDTSNAKLCETYGLSGFQNSELQMIFRRSNSEVCQAYNDGHCGDFLCTNLHYCTRHLLKKCSPRNGECKLDHSWKESDHNLWVLDVFHMMRLNDHLISKLVLVRKTSDQGKHIKSVQENAFCQSKRQEEAKGSQVLQNPRSSSVCEVSSQSSEQRKLKNLTGNYGREGISRFAESTGKTQSDYLCPEHVWGRCRAVGWCGGQHHAKRTSYLWQVKVNDQWVDVCEEDNYRVERSYCMFGDKTSKIRLESNPLTLQASINMIEMTASVYMQNDTLLEPDARVQRLSTPSFVDGGETHPFKLTCWCWYWTDDDGGHNLYEPSARQYTLEKKFLSGQKTYRFETGPIRYELYFQKMIQMNLHTGKVRKVFRRPTYVSKEDISKRSLE